MKKLVRDEISLMIDGSASQAWPGSPTAYRTLRLQDIFAHWTVCLLFGVREYGTQNFKIFFKVLWYGKTTESDRHPNANLAFFAWNVLLVADRYVVFPENT